MFTVYNQHKGCNISWTVISVEDVKCLAHASAKMRYDVFLRVFHQTNGFVTAYSVLGGTVLEHRDVTIPIAHW